eukprot:CAMPEP_0178420778 /NCGR_PEP_ID=MMETSP0689_2-20121128/26306_1 /TAXON_ID=160604 /ORGANISM="Amphidinium massartii, Strain CS-259" /LENGTH=364 /DNA_ID=CAMNT_0020042267 /DNA_START=56 /DNA_END=1150 /DNA_ORIENTATION=-
MNVGSQTVPGSAVKHGLHIHPPLNFVHDGWPRTHGACTQASWRRMFGSTKTSPLSLVRMATATVALAGCGGAIQKKGGRLRTLRRVMYSSLSDDSESEVPDTPAALLETRRKRRWDKLKESLDWTRYHLNIAVVEAAGEADVRISAGLFERIARFNACAGALPVNVTTTCADGDAVKELRPDILEQLSLGGQWEDCEVEVFDETSLNLYDVLVCLDAGAAEHVEAVLEEAKITPRPPHIVDLSDYGAYLQFRRPESPMKAWVPDYRAVLDPTYDERQAAAEPPCDDALAVWHCMPEDLARLVQPRYEALAAGLSRPNEGVELCDGHIDDDSIAYLAFHLSGLVRFLMDSYPLDLKGGPGYDGPP